MEQLMYWNILRETFYHQGRGRGNREEFEDKLGARTDKNKCLFYSLHVK
jgi:hypothetical protein